MPFCYILAGALFISTVLADVIHPGRYDYGFNVDLRLQKREPLQSPIVTGLPRVNGSSPLRRDIRDLAKDEDGWTLYILALNWMQYTDQDSPFSWYQITGIHGAPGLTWHDVSPTAGNEHSGYCTHVSILFPTWHRPYLALYEQVLYNIVQYIASYYPLELHDRFQKAADNFRVPYWDWAAAHPDEESSLPRAVGGPPTLDIAGPNGVQTISNPLFSYVFRPFNGSTFPDYPYNTWRETKRAPRPVNSPNATSNNSFVAQALDTHLPSFQQRLYNLFTNYPNYTNFSNEAWIPSDNNGTYDSLESIHDSIHTVGGGVYGHLAIIAYSGFDPLFWLHHANVDRIFAMWQVLYNNTYVVPQPAVYSSHTTSPGQTEDSQTALTPFFSNETHFWTSDEVRDLEVFNYTYGDIANKSRADVVALIHSRYGNFTPASMFLNTGRARRRSNRHAGHLSQHTSQVRPHRANGLSWNSQTSTHPPLSAVFRGNKYREWIANVRVSKQAMGGSFSIHLFLGEAPSDPTSWLVASNLIGTLGVLAHRGKHGMHGMPGRKVAGTIPMTSALMQMASLGEVSSLHVEDIVPFLKDNLEFRISLTDGTAADPRDVDGLGISIISSAVTAPDSETKLAEWGEAESHFDLFV
ncbi:Di-copper centre-containing protein [Hypoxylon sp. FL1150]|nr:Di-copper centre-containing protein [Hypoxylon sp. FL1150]